MSGIASSGSEMDEWRINALGGLDPLLLALLVAGSIAALVWTWRSLDPRLGTSRRIAIVALRAAVLALALALVLQPTLRSRRLEPRSARVALLVDVSGSMAHGEEASRLSVVRELLKRAGEDLDLLKKSYRLDWYAVADELVRAKGRKKALVAAAEARGTRLLHALRELLDGRGDDAPLAGAILISDGADTEVGSPPDRSPQLESLAAAGVPINTVAVTASGRRTDLAIASARVAPFAFSRSETPIEVSLRAVGIERSEVEVALWREGALLKRRQVRLVGETGRTEFTVNPSRLGRHVLTVTTAAPPDDEVPENNSANVVFDVVRDKYRILHLAGRPSWDQRFVREALESRPQIDLVSFYVLRTPYQSASLGRAGLALIPFPTEALFEEHLDEFDILVFQDFDPAQVGVDRYLEKIDTFVREGGALAVVGGETTFGSGCLSHGEIAETLPVRTLARRASGGRAVDETPFRARLTEAGERHPLTRLVTDPGQNRELWSSLSRLEGIAKVAGLTEGAVSLVEHPSLRCDDGPAPLIAVREIDRGRTAALTTDSLWRWRFTAPMRGEAAEVFPGLWNRIVSWLGRDPDLDRLRLSVSPQKATPGEQVTVEIELVDEAYRPVPGAELDCAISWLDADGIAHGEETRIRLDAEGRYRWEWLPSGSGPHRVTASAPGDLTATDRFLVAGSRPELSRLDPDEQLLRAIAEASGGEHLDGELEAGALELAAAPGRKVLARHDVPLWSHPLTLVALLALLFGDWMLRRRSGLG